MATDAAPTRSTRQRAGYAKSRETRARILAAALAEAVERGLRDATVARIAARADTAVGNVNYHFGSRGALLRDLMRLLMADLSERRSVATADDGDFFARYRAELLAYVAYLRANPAHVRLADEIKFAEPELYREGVRTWVGQLASRLRAGIAEGSIRPMDESEVTAQAHFLLGARHFLEDMIGHDGRTGDEAVVDAYLGLVRNGLARDRADRTHG
ncbi:MAG: TetR/AcrR family transcriptional regulator [Actinobacteria bacterium]|nr:TetR/AcrR family transcriptional regulator [Actinomycetota bacterium]